MDAPPPLETIAEGAEYSLAADAAETCFVLRCKGEGLAACLQGEDAARFLADYRTVRSQFPDWPADQALAQLWDQGGYSWLAAEDMG